MNRYVSPTNIKTIKKRKWDFTKDLLLNIQY